MRFGGSLYIPDIPAIIFSQSVAFVILRTEPFTEPRFFILSKSRGSVSAFMDHVCADARGRESQERLVTAPRGASPEEASAGAQ